ncbi:MAG: hypothetical protein ACP5SH_11005 [Syntrophobacteraceae bacterium]
MPMKALKPIGVSVAEQAEQQPVREPGLDREDRMAADRLLLYLRRLAFPETEALALTLRALREAENDGGSESRGNRIAEAMEALFHLLLEEPARNFFLNGRGGPPGASQPAVRRLPMVPEELSPTKTIRHGIARRGAPAPARRTTHGAGLSS